MPSDYFDLGDHHRPITTNSPSAQTWFDRGLVWLYGFNHEEAIVCFEKALADDPDCAMAHWGIAFAIGPNYNKAWEMFEPRERESSLATAHQSIVDGLAVEKATPVERALLTALEARYPEDPETEDYGPYNDAFAEAMGAVFEAHSNDLDITSLYVEALMGRTPWQLWDLEHRVPAEGASTAKAGELLEQAFEEDPAAWRHAGLLHMYIHLMEMSPTPELALPHGDALATLVPDSGHLVHMATHIDVLCGHYQNVVSRNHRAGLVDRPFTALRGAKNFYTIYRIHNVHFEAYGAMFQGQKTTALAAAEELRSLLPTATVAFLPDLFEAFWGVKLHVMVRFGMWQEIIDEPLPVDPELSAFTTALMRYGRTVALANIGDHEAAETEFQAFLAAQAAVPKTRAMFNNPAADVLKIAASMAEGELRYKAGDVDTGLDHLRAAAYASDHLVYDEPWGWMQPPRHALAALLMEQERFDEAESIYTADLGFNAELPRPCQHPANVWALHGLDECLTRRGADSAIVKQQLELALARADVSIGSSCFCRSKAA